ncbi:TadE/TadG family type IV pilus assembly protein [Sphingobium nicotianae]|uniref:Pilus assembly protein n=1 Tax=Sphingobium nicotianae TaxID=2782607 RepID=A0A9X1IT07_9SPHN|nr:pilus assembly protein [Sphingobium nicotianae]
MALEYAILLPVLLLMILGALDVSRMIWLQVTLERAVEAAARCAAINELTCGSAAQTQDFAASQIFGTTIDAAAFVSASASCGISVTGTVPFTFIIPWVQTRKITLSAVACYPVP